MARPRVAIVGTGVAGLGCAYFLRSRCDLTLFEQNAYAGGHTNTIDVSTNGESTAFDTGFMVFNRVTYPNLCRFFETLQVPTQPTNMSFSVQHRPSGLEYCGTGWSGLFAQRQNVFRPRFWSMLRQIDRFNREAAITLAASDAPEVSLSEYVREGGYGSDFLELYLIPMSGAVWSTPAKQMLEFPARTLLRFFQNHGFLGLNTQHPWWTVTGGSREYIRRLLPLIGGRVRLESRVHRVERRNRSVCVTTEDGRSEEFDKVILACHGDQALRILASPDRLEQRLLGEFHYQENLATVHTDASVMPRCRRAWASWNYRIDTDPNAGSASQTIYWMNSLQSVSNRTDYFVSINGEGTIRPERVLRKIRYEHPLFSLGAVRAQSELPKLNQQGRESGVFFAGSYFRYGFHEDAFTSALDCCRILAGEDVWPGTRANET